MFATFQQKSRQWSSVIALWILPVSFLLVFYFYPLWSIFQVSLSRSETGLAAPLLSDMFSPYVLRVIWFTIAQAIISTLLTLLFGLPGAYLLARYEFRGKSLLQALAGIPFVMPTLVVAAAFNSLLGPNGGVNITLQTVFHLSIPPIHFMNTLTAILLAHVFYNTTIVLRLVGDFWAHLDPRLEKAARLLGSGPLDTFFSHYLTVAGSRLAGGCPTGVHLRFHFIWRHPGPGRARVCNP